MTLSAVREWRAAVFLPIEARNRYAASFARNVHKYNLDDAEENKLSKSLRHLGVSFIVLYCIAMAVVVDDKFDIHNLLSPIKSYRASTHNGLIFINFGPVAYIFNIFAMAMILLFIAEIVVVILFLVIFPVLLLFRVRDPVIPAALGVFVLPMVVSLTILAGSHLAYLPSDIFIVHEEMLSLSIHTTALAVLGVWLIFSILIWVITARSEALRARNRSTNPHIYMARAIFRAMQRLRNAGERWTAPDVRADVIMDIGLAAKLARQYLFQKFVADNEPTLAWRTQQGLKVSLSLAQKQTWLMAPKEGTRDSLFDYLGKTLITLLSGALDRLELASDEEVAASTETEDTERLMRRVTRIILSVTRTLLVALLPAVLFMIIDQLKLLTDVTPTTLSYMKIGLFFWAVLSLMLMVDPLLKEKLATVKEAVQLFKPGAAKKE